jgi:hypothetical protein
VGPRGGVVVSDDGLFALEIPVGALDHEIEIEIEQVDCEVAAVGHCYDVHPQGTGFLKPARATFELGGMDMNPRSLALVVERDADWNKLADHGIDFEDEIIEASAMYLSNFAVVSVDR